MIVKELYDKLNEKHSFDLQCDWDNSGLICGDLKDEVRKVLVTLDINEEVCKYAVDRGCNVILSHHPIIFGYGMKSILNSKDARIIKYAIRNDLNIIVMHTNLDNSNAYVSKAIAKRLNYKELDEYYVGEDALGVVVEVSEELISVAEKIKDTFNYKAVKCTTNNNFIKTALIIGGSGSDVLNLILNSNIDLLITGDVKHSVFHDANCANKSVIEISHYEEFEAMKTVLDGFGLDVEFYDVRHCQML